MKTKEQMAVELIKSYEKFGRELKENVKRVIIERVTRRPKEFVEGAYKCANTGELKDVCFSIFLITGIELVKFNKKQQ